MDILLFPQGRLWGGIRETHRYLAIAVRQQRSLAPLATSCDPGWFAGGRYRHLLPRGTRRGPGSRDPFYRPVSEAKVLVERDPVILEPVAHKLICSDIAQWHG